MLKTLWKDETGVILSAEIVLIGTILILGVVVGLVELQCSIVAELNDLGDAFGDLNQSYNTSGVVGAPHAAGGFKARTAGTTFVDLPDGCDCTPLVMICVDPGEKT